MTVLRRLLPYLRPYTGSLIVAGLCLLIATPCQLFHPLVWKYIVDDVIIKHQPGKLWPALVVMVIVHAIGFALNGWRNYLLGNVGQRFINDLRNHVYDKLQRQSLAYFHQRRSGDLLSRAMSDVDAVQEVIIQGIDNIVGNGLAFIYVSFIIISLQPVVGTITLLPVLLVGVLIYKFNIKVKKLYREVRDRLGDVSAKLQENLSGIMTIKAFAREPHETARFQAQNDLYLRSGLKAVAARSVYFPTTFAIGFLSNVVMVGLGAVFVLRGQMSLGDLVAYRGYWWQLFSPIQTLATVNETLQRANAAGSRIFELLDEPETITDAPTAITLAPPAGHLRFEHVSFSYTDPAAPTLADLTFAVAPGQALGVVGPSGSGKSTLLNLIFRFYDVHAGSITLDGHDVRSVTQQSLRRHLGLVTQEAFLFNESIRSNLRYGRLDATDAELMEAARQANAHDFITALPNGYDTMIGERGIKLSGGQRQRLCIARAFLANPRLLLLDEATASVEPESELLIQAALQRLMAGRTTIIVSHRLSMVRDTDHILVILHGRLTEQGTHDQLMAHNGWYARMYHLQMEGTKLGERV